MKRVRELIGLIKKWTLAVNDYSRKIGWWKSLLLGVVSMFAIQIIYLSVCLALGYFFGAVVTNNPIIIMPIALVAVITSLWFWLAITIGPKETAQMITLDFMERLCNWLEKKFKK